MGRFAADEVGGGDNVDEQEHCEWGILLEEASWKNPCFNSFAFCSNLRHSCEQPNLITQRQGLLKYTAFRISFFAPFPHQLCVREIFCKAKSSSQGGTILEGSLIFSSPPQSYPSWEGPLFKLKRAWCIFAIIVTTYTSTTTVANEICSLCLLCTCVHMYMYVSF